MKRGRSEGVKYFKAPFRKENYSSHHRGMHSTRRAEYRELEPSAKKLFFDIGTISESQTTMHAFAAPRTPQLHVLIDKDIVDGIIGEMMFHPEGMDGITRARLLESFVPTLDSSEDAADAGDLSLYAIPVTNTTQFQLVAQYLAAGKSFRQVSQVIMETKEVLGIGSIGSCSEGIVSRCARFICAMTLQCIAELLRQCWAFSVALDMATHMATSYCDVRIRICHKSTMHDFHLLSIPVHERHTGETIFNTFAKAMDALFPDWRETITGASSDGEKKMAGRYQGVITRIHRVAKPGFMRVWCGPIKSTCVCSRFTWQFPTRSTRHLHCSWRIFVGSRTSSRTNGASSLSFATRAGSTWSKRQPGLTSIGSLSSRTSKKRSQIACRTIRGGF
jgi:hypothetical protein